MPYSGALVIKVLMANQEVRSICMDHGVAVNILWSNCFEKLGINRSYLKPCSLLQTFAQVDVQLERGSLTSNQYGRLPKIEDDVDRLLCSRHPSPYNIILDRDCLTPNKVICSFYHLFMKFSTDQGIVEAERTSSYLNTA